MCAHMRWVQLEWLGRPCASFEKNPHLLHFLLLISSQRRVLSFFPPLFLLRHNYLDLPSSLAFEFWILRFEKYLQQLERNSEIFSAMNGPHSWTPHMCHLHMCMCGTLFSFLASKKNIKWKDKFTLNSQMHDCWPIYHEKMNECTLFYMMINSWEKHIWKIFPKIKLRNGRFHDLMQKKKGWFFRKLCMNVLQ